MMTRLPDSDRPARSYRASRAGTARRCLSGIPSAAAPLGSSPCSGDRGRVARIVLLQRRRRDVVAPPPDLHLLLAELRGRFRLVQALQRAVVPLVQPPGRGPESTSGPFRPGRSRACGSRASAPRCRRDRKHSPSFFRTRPPSCASWMPFSDKSTSVQPVKRFSLFHVALAVAQQYDFVHFSSPGLSDREVTRPAGTPCARRTSPPRRVPLRCAATGCISRSGRCGWPSRS